MLVFQLSQDFKFSAYGLLIIVNMMAFNLQFGFCNAEQATFLPMQEDMRRAVPFLAVYCVR